MQTWIVISDLHVPFHDQIVLDKILKMLYENKKRIYGLIINGDFLDMYAIGHYTADSLHLLRDISLGEEYKIGHQIISHIVEALGKNKKYYYLWGNHEWRYWKEVEKGDRGKYGSALVNPTEALRLRERGFEVYENYKADYITLGDHLDVFHGYWANIYAARKHLLEFQRCCLFGHTHRLQVHIEGKKAAFNIGFLGDTSNKAFSYMYRHARHKFVRAFAIVNIDNQGDFHVLPITVTDRKFYAFGKMY